MRISGCIIARNEQENIANCINSLKHIVDEIVVVDTGSEDDTVKIAEELDAFVLKRKWENDFSKARNFALERAKGDWIIFLDADEYFHEDSVAAVRPFIEKVHANRNIEGIQCRILNIDKDTGRIIGSGGILRIFRNYKKFRYINKIHEEIRNNGIPLNGIDASNELALLHTGYSASVQRDKALRNLEILKDNGGKGTAAYYLATTYFSLDDYENAEKYVKLALEDETVATHDAFAYKLHVISIFMTMKNEPSNQAKIQRQIREANQKYGTHPEVAAAEAAYLLQEKQYEKALEKYLYALDCQEKYGAAFGQNNFAESIHGVYFNTAQILSLMNREADALEYYIKSLQTSKYFSDAFIGMFALFRSLPDEEIIAFTNSLYDVRNREDLNFIIEQIIHCDRPIVASYYKKKLEAVALE